MKKLTAFLLSLMFILSAIALADSSTEEVSIMPYEISLNEEIELDDWVITPETSGFWDSYGVGSYWTQKVYSSGAETQFAIVKFYLVNYGLEAAEFFNNAEITLTFTTAKREYSFSGFALQSFDGWVSANDQGNFGKIDPLYKAYYFFACQVPNSVETTEGRVEMTIETEDYVFTHVLRES